MMINVEKVKFTGKLFDHRRRRLRQCKHFAVIVYISIRLNMFIGRLNWQAIEKFSPILCSKMNGSRMTIDLFGDDHIVARATIINGISIHMNIMNISAHWFRRLSVCVIKLQTVVFT